MKRYKVLQPGVFRNMQHISIKSERFKLSAENGSIRHAKDVLSTKLLLQATQGGLLWPSPRIAFPHTNKSEAVSPIPPPQKSEGSLEQLPSPAWSTARTGNPETFCTHRTLWIKASLFYSRSAFKKEPYSTSLEMWSIFTTEPSPCRARTLGLRLYLIYSTTACGEDRHLSFSTDLSITYCKPWLPDIQKS